MLKLAQLANFSLQWQISPNLPQNSISVWKQRKWTWPLNCVCLNECMYQILQFWILGSNWPKKDIYGRKRKSKRHYWILHIQSSIRAKFQLKVKFFISSSKSTQKGYFQSKKKKINTTVLFWILVLV